MIKWSRILVTFVALLPTSCGSSKSHKEADRGSSMVTSQQDDLSASASASPNPIGELSTLQQETAAAMRAASGSDTPDRWIRQMIAHQEGAIRFSQLLIKTSSQQRLRDLAASTVVQASENIRALQFVSPPRRDPGGDLDPLDRAQPGTSKVFTKPEGAAFDAAWLTTMIAFHANGARVARAAAYHGEEGSAKTLARQLAVQQDNDAAALRRTLTPRETFLGKRPT